jgi:hypothetical protein
MKFAEQLGNRDRRKVGNNTYLERRDKDSVALRLHDTDIITETPAGYRVNTGGWQTVTTKDRLNNWLPVRIHQRNCVWYWQDGTPFTDGDLVTFDGRLKSKSKKGTESAIKKLQARVNAYARLCASSVPMKLPSGADCWYCYMETQDGETMGDAFSDTDHLKLHMEEGYVVPSLVYRALKERGCGDAIMCGTFVSESHANFLTAIAKRHVSSAVRKYLRRRLGLPG